MAKLVKGDVIVVPFPFSDLTQSKKRPALVISTLEGGDVILCQITSQAIKDRYSILIEDEDFESGSLKQRSNVRPNRIFTADSHIILYRVGNLKKEKTQPGYRTNDCNHSNVNACTAKGYLISAAKKRAVVPYHKRDLPKGYYYQSSSRLD